MPHDVLVPAAFDVATVAAALGEQEAGPRGLIANIFYVFGRFGTWRLFEKTLHVEAHGGLMVRNGSRRRTPGGTFLHLASLWCQTPQERARIFGPAPTPTPPRPAVVRPVPSLDEALRGLLQLRAGECRMKLTLIGRPQQVVERDTYVVFKMTGTLPPSLPKGLPKAPPPPLSWVVMVNNKQWAKASASLDSDPTAKAVIEGYPAMQGTAHVLLATMCTTTALQRAKAEPQEVSV